MKTFATAKMFKDDQGGVENYDLTIDFQIPEIGLDVDLVPFVEKIGKNYKKLSNIEEYVLKEIESRDERIKIYDEQGTSYDADPLTAMLFVIDVFFSSLHKCSLDGRKPFHVNINDPKSKIKEYGEQWKTMIDQLDQVKKLNETKNQVESSVILEKLERLSDLIIKTNELIGELPYQSEDTPQKKTRKPRAKIEEPQENVIELDMSAFQAPPTQPFDLSNLIPNTNEEYAVNRTN